MPSVLEIARGYVAAGLSVIPIRCDGSKAPAYAWKAFQQRIAPESLLTQWFVADEFGIAILGGAVSGNLEILDFDDGEAYAWWSERVQDRLPGLLERLPIVLTPAGGRHVYYRLPRQPMGNRKLAWPAEGQKALLETRGEGGYVLAPGCPAACHPSGGLYRHVYGPPLTAVPVLEEPLA